MHRTEGTNHATNRFANGPPGTVVEEKWLNAVQEEIAHVIESCGVTLKEASTETEDQLWDALLVGGVRFDAGTVIAAFGQNSAPTGWTRKEDWQDNAMLCYAASGNIGSGGGVNPQSTHTHGPGSFANPHNHQWYKVTAAGSTDQSYASNGAAQNLVNANQTGIKIKAAAGAEDKIDADQYTDNDAGTVAGTSDPNTAPYYQEVIAATKD